MPTMYTHWLRRPWRTQMGHAPRAAAQVLEHGGEALPFLPRLVDAAQRRARSYAQFARLQSPDSSTERALDWLERHVARCGSTAMPGGASCPGLAGAILATASRFGRETLAARLADWLMDVQLADGSLPDGNRQATSLWNTALAAQGWLAHLPFDRRHTFAARRACDFLADHIDYRGRIHAPQSDAALERWAGAAMHLAYLPALVAAAEHWQAPEYMQAARSLLSAHQRQARVAWGAPLRMLAAQVEGALACGDEQLARELLRLPTVSQRPTGVVPDRLGSREVSLAGLARLAVLWLRLGETDRSHRAIGWISRLQQVDGGLIGRRAPGWRRAEPASAWAVTCYLDAVHAQVETSFSCATPDLPQAIDPADGRLHAVAALLATLPAGSCVADVGCGSGRYLHWLARWFPNLRFTGIDPSHRLLASLPKEVEARAGGLLRIPAENGEFDAVFSVEAIEHALDARRAVAELVRVTRPGGRIIVIDKNRAFRALSHHQPWERWFDRAEPAQWLAAGCDQVHCIEVAHGASCQPTGLFLAWIAQRSDAVEVRRAA